MDNKRINEDGQNSAEENQTIYDEPEGRTSAGYEIDFSNNDQMELENYKKILKNSSNKHHQFYKENENGEGFNGRELEANSEFEEYDESKENIDSEANNESYEEKKLPIKKKYTKVLISSGVILLLFICIGTYYYLIAAKGNQKPDSSVLTWGVDDSQGNINFITGGGEILTVQGNYEKGYIPASREYIILLTYDGNIVKTDKVGKNPRIIIEDVWELEEAREEGFVYATREFDVGDGTAYYNRYLINTEESAELGNGKYRVSQDGFNIIYSGSDGIYILNEEMKEKTFLGDYAFDYSNDISISSSGHCAIWSEWTDEDIKYYYYCNGEIGDIFTVENTYWVESKAVYSKSTDEFVLYSDYIDELYIKKENTDIHAIKLEDKEYLEFWPAANVEYSKNNNFIVAEVGNLDYFYIKTYNYNTDTNIEQLFYVNIEGEMEEILFGAKNIQLMWNADLVYQNEEDQLVYGRVNEKEIEENIVAEDYMAMLFYWQASNKILYFSELAEYEYSLFYYIPDRNESFLIREKGLVDGFFNTSNSEEVLLFSEYDSESVVPFGNLDRYTIDGEIINIDDNVLIEEELDMININETDGFYYKKYLQHLDDGTGFLYNLYYFDGEKTNLLKENIVQTTHKLT